MRNINLIDNLLNSVQFMNTSRFDLAHCIGKITVTESTSQEVIDLLDRKDVNPHTVILNGKCVRES
jgi:hypothetical protein